MTAPQPRQRLRFDSAQVEEFRDGSCQARVSLEWNGGAVFQGRADGAGTLEGRLRASALACLRGAETATRGSLDLELLGLKAVRAFDERLVLVSLGARSGEQSYRLLGSAICPDGDTDRGAVLAVLDAINRVLERYVPPS